MKKHAKWMGLAALLWAAAAAGQFSRIDLSENAGPVFSVGGGSAKAAAVPFAPGGTSGGTPFGRDGGSGAGGASGDDAPGVRGVSLPVGNPFAPAPAVRPSAAQDAMLPATPSSQPGNADAVPRESVPDPSPGVQGPDASPVDPAPAARPPDGPDAIPPVAPPSNPGTGRSPRVAFPALSLDDGNKLVRVELKIRPLDDEARFVSEFVAGVPTARALNDSAIHYQVFVTDPATDNPLANIGWEGPPGERGRLLNDFVNQTDYDVKPLEVLSIPWIDYREMEEGYRKLTETFRIEVATDPWQPQDVQTTELVRQWLENELVKQAARRNGASGSLRLPLVFDDILLRQCLPSDHSHWWARSFFACLRLVDDYWKNAASVPAQEEAGRPAVGGTTVVTNVVTVTNVVVPPPNAGGWPPPAKVEPGVSRAPGASPSVPAEPPRKAESMFHVRRVAPDDADLLVYASNLDATVTPNYNFSYGFVDLSLKNNTRYHIALCAVYIEFEHGASGTTVFFRDIPPGGEAEGENQVAMVGAGIEKSQEAGVFLFPAMVLLEGEDGQSIRDLYENGETPSIGYLPLRKE